MTRLRTCEGCARHVFVTETRCPFCRCELAPASRSPIFDIRASMSRAQRVALVAAVAGQTLLGCSDDGDSGNQGGTGGMTMQGSGGTSTPSTGGKSGGASGGVAQPVYGAPIDPGGSGQGTGGTGFQPMYGGPISPPSGTGGTAGPQDGGANMSDDASADAGDASTASDAGQDAGRVQALYGAPVPVYGAPIPGK